VDWQGLLHNKWALAGVGVAGAAGLFVFLRRRGAGGASSTPATGAQASPGYSGGVGQFDSTGTDVANWLGHYSESLDAQFKEFLAQAGAAGGPASIPPGPSGTGTPPTVVYAPTRTVEVTKYWGPTPAWNSTLSGIAKHEGTTVAQLLTLNPSIKNPNLIYKGQQIRVP